MVRKLILCLFLLMAFAGTGFAASARSSSIKEWAGACSGGTRDWWPTMCMTWRQRMGDYGWGQWWRNYGYVTPEKYVDPARETWGQDLYNIDGGDAGMICTHGGWNDDGWYGVMYNPGAGSCSLKQSQMKLGHFGGAGHMRFWHMSSCNSIRWDLKTKWFGAAEARVHVITGFHGYMYIGSKYVDEYKGLADQGFSSTGVGYAWANKMHHVSHWYNSWHTVCPISLGFGDTSQRSYLALTERYNSNWPDRAPNWMTWLYWRGCNPDGGPALPQ